MANRLVSAARSVGRLVPLFGQLAGYDRKKARGDLTAGLTTAVLLVPQAMAYAMLAGLPPIVGLYAATIPILIYAFVGSSPHLSVGPVALLSLVTIAGLSPLATPGSTEFVALAATLALLMGLLQVGLGVLRLAFIADLLSHSVMTGFTAAAAVLIALTQLGPLLGVDLPSAQQAHVVVLAAIDKLGAVSLSTAVAGAISVAILVVLRWKFPRVPGALVVLVAAGIAVWALGPEAVGLAVVGDVPSGLPALTIPELSLESMWALLPTATAGVLVLFMEAFAVARVTARETDDEVDPRRELLGLGGANVAASFVGAYPVGGAFSRTAVSARAGAKTNLAALVTAACVVAVLLFLTPVFQVIPSVVLSAIILVAVAGLVDVPEIIRLFKVDRRDFALALLTFAVTLGFGVEIGVAAGVGASLAVFLIRVARPKVVKLGWLPSTDAFDVEAEPVDGVLVLRVQAPAFFANARYVRDQILTALEDEDEVHCVVLDAGAIDHVDASAELALQEILEELEKQKVELRIAAATPDVRGMLDRSGLGDRLGEVLHSTVREAVAAAVVEAAAASMSNPIPESEPEPEPEPTA